ncbi:hypothetical protein F511_17247 [Dorcoceras hygrometricum]|uniref:CCHC-type domain-containing protein n=1 Tax=Dorcoceras hygrometricum TaxID=472368 RepID=A0A2Z7B276_9LAMI|nr:hypothetical protein F511_17247 [Dorcoceras hygrometricum]
MTPRRDRSQQDDATPHPPPPPPQLTPYKRASMDMLAGITRLLARQSERPGKSHEEDVAERCCETRTFCYSDVDRDRTSSQQSGRQRFRPRGHQFKKKGGSSSSGTGSSSSSGSKVEYCGFCGGRHPSTQRTGVQGSCNVCGQYGNFEKVCPLAGSQQAATPPHRLRVVLFLDSSNSSRE